MKPKSGVADLQVSRYAGERDGNGVANSGSPSATLFFTRNVVPFSDVTESSAPYNAFGSLVGTPMRFIAAVIVSFGCLAPEAVAQEIPDYDTQAFCERRTGADTADNRRFAACLMIEDLGLAELEDYWPEVNETMRVDCIEEANLTESYVVLASCVMPRVREHRRR